MAFFFPHNPSIFSAAVLLLLFFHACSSSRMTTTTNTLGPGESISKNQTIVSNNQRFKLGFFSPTDPPSIYYIAIWFNQIPNTTVVWVCNRENPLLQDPSSAALSVAADGNLLVLETRNNSVLWSTNISSSAPRSNVSAILLDSGNLVLRGGGDPVVVLWQSFDHPGDTLLADMKLYMNVSTRSGNRLVSWRAPRDPSPGEFSLGFDPATALQIMIWKGAEVWMRSLIVAGSSFLAARDDDSASFIGVIVDSSNQSVDYSFQTAEGSNTVWVMLDPSGVIRFYLWEPGSNSWELLSSTPAPCSYYNPCGPNSVCYLNSTVLTCDCLRGYRPTSVAEWGIGNYSGGCGRKVEFRCGGDDEFAKLGGLKVPDGFRLLRDASPTECETWCLSNCNCTAYLFSNTSVIGSTTRCLVWEGELVDAKVANVTGGEDLYLRLHSSELGSYGSTSRTRVVIIATVTPLLALGMMALGFSLYIHKNRSKQRTEEESETVIFEEMGIPEKSGSLLTLDFNKLVMATNNFSMENKIGQGGFGPVYKGRLQGGQEIAIKALSRNSGQGFEQFRNEVDLIARLQHRNLVKLLGWCIHGNEKLLIYEFMPNKSLDRFVFDPSLKAELNWAKRFEIVHGIVQGLLYLHRYSRLCVIHRDLKTSNILLDEEMNPKISDFGLARIIDDGRSEANTERVTGTLGYMSPEYAFDGLFSEKSDVFSLGVMLMEITTGKRVTGYYPCKRSFNLLGYVWEHWKEGRVLELVDASMGNGFCQQEVLRCFQIALLCVQEDAHDRPSTPSILSMLSTEIAALPSPKQPAFSTERYHENSSMIKNSTSVISVDASSYRRLHESQ